MKAQKTYWLKYKESNLEWCFRCDTISDMKKFVSDNNIKDEQIIEIIKFN